MLLMLFCMMLIVYAEDKNGDAMRHATTIPTVIIMTMTIMLPVAPLVTLLLRCHQYKQKRGLGSPNKNFKKQRQPRTKIR